MIPVTTFAGRRVAVFGLARSGIAAAKALAAGGAEVAAWDDGAASRARAAEAGLALVDLGEADWRGFAALVLSPGVPLTHPQPHWTVGRARAAGIEVIGDTELFFRERAVERAASKVVGITGTNGKSTTTALAAHVLREAGLSVAMGGNIGEAVLGLAPFAEVDVYVLELSSYQIDLTPSGRCDAAVLLNLTPDHLDRHGTMANYAGVKERLVAGAATAIVGVDDDWCRAIEARLRSNSHPVIAISTALTGSLRPGSFIGEGASIRRVGEGGAIVDCGSLVGIGSLRGAHNMQNALAVMAIAAAIAPATPPAGIIDAFRSFPGLAHRLQQVARIGNVLFVNDSKATNADSAEKALASFDRDIYWIAGGRPKEGGIASLAPAFARIARAYLIGEAAEAFAETLAGHVPVTMAGTIETAVVMAAADAAASGRSEPVVLLSPACASFDQFPDFEARGRAFVAAVERLATAKAS